MNFSTLVNNLVGFGNQIVVPLLIAAAGMFFLWGVVKYFFLGGASDESRAQGRSFMLWSLLALAVMVSAWGLVRLVMQTFTL